MKRYLFLVPVLMLALTASAFAQDKPIVQNADNADTVKITLSGSIDLDYIYRNGELLEVRDGSNPGDTNNIEGRATMRLDIDLANNVQAVFEISTFGADGSDIAIVGGNGEETIVYVSEASVTLNEFLNENLDVTMGIVPYSINFVPGGSLLFDPRYSDTLSSTRTAAPNVPMGLDELQPTGLVGNYQRDEITLDVLIFPSIDDNGSPTVDESAYGVVFDYASESLGKEGSHFGIAAMLFNQGGLKGSAIITIGGGATLVDTFVDRLTLFGEAYFQFGSVQDQGGTDIDAGGFAFQLGGQYNLEGDSKPYLGMKVTWLTGDDDATDEDEDNFLSYESIDDFLIMENQYFGLNMRSNYWAIKFFGGASFSVGGQPNDMDLVAKLGLFTASEDIAVGSDEEDALGIELDLEGVYHVNKQTSLTAGVGLLFSSDVLELTTAEEEDSTWVFTVGCESNH